MEISENMSETIFPDNCLDWRMSGRTLSDTQMMNRERVQPCQTLLNRESKPIFDLMSPRLNDALNCIERENNPGLNSSHQSRSSSATIKASLPERNPNLLISISPKSMLSEQVSEIKEKQRKDPELEESTNYHTSLPLRDSDTTIERPVQDIPRLHLNQMVKEIG